MPTPMLPNLHDATLVAVVVDWPAGTAAVEVEVVGGRKHTLHASGLRRLTIPREQPWGPSVSINRADLTARSEAAGALFQIEMQSGDQIEIDADSFEIA
jgi:hypothetical protein